MKYQVIVALFICAAVVSADYYDGDSDDDDVLDIMSCYSGLQSCMSHVQKFQSSDPSQIAASIQTIGIRPVCQDVKKSTACVQTLMQQKGVCPPEMIDVFYKVQEAINYVCVEKIEEIVSHWDCLFSAQMDPNQEECQGFAERVTRCESAAMIKCLDKAVKSTPICKPGASDIFAGIVNKMVAIVPHCAELNGLQAMLMNFLKK